MRPSVIFTRKFSKSVTYIKQCRDQTSITKALSMASSSNSLSLGTQLHSNVIKFGFSNEIFTTNNLIKMYWKCGNSTNALKVFDEMPERNLVSWTLIISGAIENREFEIGLGMFVDMRRAGWMPNEYALGSVMKGCIGVGVFEFGRCVHCFSIKTRMERNRFVGSAVLSMYAELESVEAVERVFECVESVDVGCYNALIGGYANCSFGFEAVKIMSLMKVNKISMDSYTYINALKGCVVMNSLDFGKQIHGMIYRNEVDTSVSLMNALMDMYLKNGAKNSALKVFGLVHNRDIISWNTLFSSLPADAGAREVATLFLELMLTELIPNHVTFSILFRLCGSLLELDLGLQLCCLATKLGLIDEFNTVSSLINMLAKCGAMEMASVLSRSFMSENITFWNEMIQGCTLNGSYAEALQLFHDLWVGGVEADEYTFSCILETCNKSADLQVVRQLHGAIIKSGFDSHLYVSSSLIKNYITFGLLEDSFKIFNGLDIVDLAAWGGMISALGHQGFYSEASKFYVSFLREGEKPDEFIFGSILNSSASTGSYQQTKSVHAQCLKMRYETQPVVASAIIDAYAKCGDIEGARMAFHQSLSSDDVILYNTMIMAYAHHGLVAEAMNVLDMIKSTNLQPSQATFVSVISAYSHIGLIDQGLRLFESMYSVYKKKPSPNIYGCMVDMLSRNGYLEDARSIIERMPFPGWPAIYRSLLSGCRIHGNREVGEWAAERLLELAPENDAAYVLLSEVYSGGGNWESAAKVRLGMVNKGVSKGPGYTRIEI